jgi:hypothetical protein
MATPKFMVRGLILSALLPLVLGASAAQAQTTLRWKFKQGDKLTYVTEQATNSKGSVMGMEFETTMSQTTDLTWMVKAVGSDGVAEINQTIDRIRMKMETPFGNFEYDSKENKQIEGPFGDVMGPILGAMAGAEVMMKMAPTGDVRDVKLPEKLAESLQNPALAQFGNTFTEDGLKQLVQSGAGSLGAFPEGRISKGETWERKFEMKMPPVGTMKVATTSTYAGPDTRDGTKVEKIELNMTQSVEIEPGGMFEIKISSQDNKGAAYFDNATGRLIAQEMKQKMKMEIEFMGNVIEQEVEMSASTKLNPGDKKTN